MRVALVCPYDLSAPGGVQSHIRDLSRELRRRGHAAVVLAPHPAEEAPQEAVYVGRSVRIRASGTQIDVNVAWGEDLRRLRAVLRDDPFDVIHYHTPWNPVLPWQVWLAAPRCSAAVATFHDVPADTRGGRFLSRVVMPLAAFAMKRVCLDSVIAVSDAPAGYLRRFLRPDEVHVIPNGVDVQAFAPERNAPLARFRDGKRNLLFLGRLEARKGIFHLLEAFGRLKPRLPDLRLIVAGEATSAAAWSALVAERALDDVVLLGQIRDEEKAALYASCDVFCSPAPYGESFGIVLVEAMASGKPAVGAANLGYRTLLRDDLLAVPGDARDLERLLYGLLCDDGRRVAAAQWGLEQARRYDWSGVTGRIVEVYQGAISARLTKPGPAAPPKPP